MNAHVSQTGGDGDGLVRYHPHLSTPPIRLHGEAGCAAIDGANSSPFQGRHDFARDFIGLIRGVVELYVRDGPRRSTDILAVHAENEAHESLSAGKNCENVTLLVGDLRPPGLHKPNIVRSRLKAHLAKPGAVQRLPPRRLIACPFPFPKLLYCRMFCQLRHGISPVQDIRCIYIN
jgi:hypothetical protein